jgi:hypothetical protein
MKKFIESVKKVLMLLLSLFMESDSKLSMTRVSIAVVLGSFVHWNNQLIEAGATGIHDLPYGLAAFLAALYNFNKGGTISLGGGGKNGTQN